MKIDSFESRFILSEIHLTQGQGLTFLENVGEDFIAFGFTTQEAQDVLGFDPIKNDTVFDIPCHPR